MVYLAIKELSKDAEDVMMVTASLTKDMNSKNDLIYRPNAVRALCKITDASMMQGIERFVKQSIVDKNSAAASAAIVSAIHLFPLNKDVVRRWANEVQESISSKGVSTQYHAIGLLYQMRSHDKMAVIKMVHNYAKGSLRSPHAVCMLIRYAWKIMDDESPSSSHSLYEYLETWLRHKSDMVVYEAARAICNLKDVTPKELFPAVSALQLLLVNHKATLRFAAIRTLNALAMTHPTVVFPCNLDLENLITDTNRSISTFAITTLLKTGNEQSVDRLMKQISGFMSEISDDFKIIVVDAIRSLCLKFPAKHISMLTFLKDILRDEGGYEYKRAIVEAIFDIIHHVPESKETVGLEHLCEFIEDCDYAKLAVRILHVLGSEGPRTAHPTKYIRYIYNRVILENSVVRAAAVSALAQFAEHLDGARERIKILLERCTDDNDDEVRDRAVMFLRILHNHELNKKYVANDSSFAWATFEDNLNRYMHNPEAHQVPFNMNSVPIVSRAQEHMELQRKKAEASELSVTGSLATPQSSTTAPALDGFAQQSEYARVMSQIPQLAQLGTLFKSSNAVQLTEAEEEYVIHCVKHVFPNHFVFQFDCKNTLNDYILENVTIDMNCESSEDDDIVNLVPLFCIPAEKLVYDVPGSVYAVYQRVNHCTATGKFALTLRFHVRDCDPDTGVVDEQSYPDEYAPEAVNVYIGDYMLPTYVPAFETAWSELDNQATETFALGEIKTAKEATETITQQLGLKPTELIIKEAPRTQVCFGGTFVGGIPCLAKVNMVINPSDGVTMQLNVKTGIAELSERLANSIQ
ncbi:adaptin N terminal region-domain-containing protein [Globomyces pollinis-pini]|nr:adaptin N terminal region-domain-containing protein [Globomyces pollinis-pini]